MVEYFSKLISSVTSGRKTVTNAGTRENFSSFPCRYAVITAIESNTDVVVVGGSDVIALAGTRIGVTLSPLQNVRLDISNLNILWIDSVVNGEGVTFAIFN